MARINKRPDGAIEVERTANVGTRGFPAKCPGCGRVLFLVYADPELHKRECCNYEMTLETKRVDVAIYRLPDDPSKVFLSKMTPFESEAS